MNAQQVVSALCSQHLPLAIVLLAHKVHGAHPVVPTASKRAKPVRLVGGVQQRVPFIQAHASPAHPADGTVEQVPLLQILAQHAALVSTAARMGRPQNLLAKSAKQGSTSRSRPLAKLFCAFRAPLEITAMLKLLPAASTALWVHTVMLSASRGVRHALTEHGRQEWAPSVRACALAGSRGRV